MIKSVNGKKDDDVITNEKLLWEDSGRRLYQRKYALLDTHYCRVGAVNTTNWPQHQKYKMGSDITLYVMGD